MTRTVSSIRVDGQKAIITHFGKSEPLPFDWHRHKRRVLAEEPREPTPTGTSFSDWLSDQDELERLRSNLRLFWDVYLQSHRPYGGSRITMPMP